jgi:hypothetical protein
MDMPEFNLFDTVREFSLQHWQMLSVIDRYNVMGACHIAFTESLQTPNFPFNCDATRGQTNQGVLRDRPDIACVKRQIARDSLPVKATPLGKVIE